MTLRTFPSLCGVAALVASFVAGSTPVCASLRDRPDIFFEAGPSAPKHLPANAFYPQGRRFLFSIALPPNGSMDAEQLAEYKRLGVACLFPEGAEEENGGGNLPELEGGAPIGLSRAPAKEGALGEIAFAGKEALAKTLVGQLRSAPKQRTIAFWALQPAELQFKQPHEMAYLAAASAVIKEHDPLKRPLWTYLPPEATTAYLSHIAPWVDYLGKALEPDEAATKASRIWFRWAMERAVEAIHETDAEATPVAVLVSPRLTSGSTSIAATLRHDLYLSLLAGAKGVITASPRYPNAVDAATQDAFQSASMSLARELLGPAQLGEVLLFGEEREMIEVDIVDGPSEVELRYPAGGVTEPMVFSSISHVELVYGKEHYLFLVNSALERVNVMVGGMPYAAVRAESLFDTRAPIEIAEGEFEVELEPLEVKIYRMTRR